MGGRASVTCDLGREAVYDTTTTKTEQVPSDSGLRKGGRKEGKKEGKKDRRKGE